MESDLFNHEYDNRPNWTTRSFLFQLITTITKLVIFLGFFKSKHKKFESFLLAVEKKSFFLVIIWSFPRQQRLCHSENTEMRLMRTPYSVKELWRKYYSTCLNKVRALFSGGKYFVQNEVWTTVHTHLLAKIMPFYNQALANISKNSCPDIS